jgi:hypothetical protein
VSHDNDNDDNDSSFLENSITIMPSWEDWHQIDYLANTAVRYTKLLQAIATTLNYYVLQVAERVVSESWVPSYADQVDHDCDYDDMTTSSKGWRQPPAEDNVDATFTTQALLKNMNPFAT